MKTFIIELVSNASMDVYGNNTLSSFTNFLPEQVNLDEGEWEVALVEISYPAWYNNITEGKFRYKPDSDSPVYKLSIAQGLYPNIQSVIIAMQTEITTVLNNAEHGMEISVNEFKKKIEFQFANNGALLNLASNDIANVIGFPSPCLIPPAANVAMLPYDIQRIHTVMVYTDIIQHGIIGDTKAPILRCFPLTPRFKNESLTIHQYMNYQSFDKLQFKKILKTSFHSIQLDLRSSMGEKIPFAGIGLTRATLIFRQIATEKL